MYFLQGAWKIFSVIVQKLHKVAFLATLCILNIHILYEDALMLATEPDKLTNCPPRNKPPPNTSSLFYLSPQDEVNSVLNM